MRDAYIVMRAKVWELKIKTILSRKCLLRGRAHNTPHRIEGLA